MPRPQRRHEPVAHAAGIDRREVARFAAMAARWWDAEGEARPLHRLMPVRLAYIRDQAAGHFARDPRWLRPFAGLSVLDVGCGGGLLAEPMARLGAQVTAIDAAKAAVRVARAHARAAGLTIVYRTATAERLAERGLRFDLVLCLEVIEHVPDAGALVRALAELVAPGGALVVATLNRTPKSFALAIVGAEYVLRWLAPGTHRWDRFVRPAELAGHLRTAGLALHDVSGVSLDLATGGWRLGADPSVNYMAFASRPR